MSFNVSDLMVETFSCPNNTLEIELKYLYNLILAKDKMTSFKQKSYFKEILYNFFILSKKEPINYSV